MKVETHNHPTAISPFPGRRHRRRRRDPRRRRHRPRRAAQGRADRLLGQQPAPARHRRALGARPGRQARAHRQRAADHDRGPAGRRRLQQRVRPAQPGRLLPRLRADRGRRAARLPQADHDRRRPGRDQRRPDAQAALRPPARCWCSWAGRACASAWAAARPARWPPAPTPRRWTSTRCSAATPRSSAARRRSSTTAGRWATHNPIAGDPRRRRRRPQQRLPRAGRRRRAGRHASTCGACRWRRAAWRPKEIWCNESQERYVLAIDPDLHAAVRADVRARALPVRRGRRGHRRARAGARGRPRRRARHRHADGGAAGQAAAMHRDVQRVRAAARRRWT